MRASPSQARSSSVNSVSGEKLSGAEGRGVEGTRSRRKADMHRSLEINLQKQTRLDETQHVNFDRPRHQHGISRIPRRLFAKTCVMLEA